MNFKPCVYLCTFVVSVCGTLTSCIYFSQGTHRCEVRDTVYAYINQVP